MTFGSEVENMLFTEWNMDEALRIRGEESKEEGIAESFCGLVYKGLLSLKDAISNSGLSEATFMDWMHRLYPDYKG